jgi:paraquat-inducible protein B
MSDSPPARTVAQTRRSWWPGWIWAVPVAALLIVGWLIVRALAEGGTSVKIAFDQAPGVRAHDTKVVYRGVIVGEVAGVSLASDASQVMVTLKIDRDAKRLLRSGTQFWLIGASPSLEHLAELKDAFTGPQIGLQPGAGRPATSFQGLDEPPQDAPLGPQIPYGVRLGGAVGELQAGAPVRLRGFRVGRVSAVSLRYDQNSGQLAAAAILRLEPERMGLTAPRANWRTASDAMMDRLIREGLRAELAQSPPLVGSREVALDFAAPAGATGLGADRVIPAAAGADIQDLERKADAILAKIDAVPIEQIGQNVRGATDRLRQILRSPHIDQTLAQVDDATASLDRTIHTVSPDVAPLVHKLRQTADDADQTVDAVRTLVRGDPTSQDADVPSALRELTNAARSFRTLADEIERHPEALIRGKPKERR